MNNFRLPAILVHRRYPCGSPWSVPKNRRQRRSAIAVSFDCQNDGYRRIDCNVFLQPHKETSIKTRPNEYKTCSIVT